MHHETMAKSDNNNESSTHETQCQPDPQQQQQNDDQEQQEISNLPTTNNLKQTTTNSTASVQTGGTTTKAERNPLEDLYSTKPWGQTAVRQDTPWPLPPPSPTPPHLQNLIQNSNSSGNQFPGVQPQQPQQWNLTPSSRGILNSNNLINKPLASSFSAAAAAQLKDHQIHINHHQHQGIHAQGPKFSTPNHQPQQFANSNNNGGYNNSVIGGGSSGLANNNGLGNLSVGAPLSAGSVVTASAGLPPGIQSSGIHAHTAAGHSIHSGAHGIGHPNSDSFRNSASHQAINDHHPHHHGNMHNSSHTQHQNPLMNHHMNNQNQCGPEIGFSGRNGDLLDRNALTGVQGSWRQAGGGTGFGSPGTHQSLVNQVAAATAALSLSSTANNNSSGSFNSRHHAISSGGLHDNFARAPGRAGDGQHHQQTHHQIMPSIVSKSNVIISNSGPRSSVSSSSSPAWSSSYDQSTTTMLDNNNELGGAPGWPSRSSGISTSSNFRENQNFSNQNSASIGITKASHFDFVPDFHHQQSTSGWPTDKSSPAPISAGFGPNVGAIVSGGNGGPLMSGSGLANMSGYNNSEIGTWSPVPGAGGNGNNNGNGNNGNGSNVLQKSRWDADDGTEDDSSRRKDPSFDDGTAIWGSASTPTASGGKVGGIDWAGSGGDKQSSSSSPVGGDSGGTNNNGNITGSDKDHHRASQNQINSNNGTQNQAFRPHSSSGAPSANEYSSSSASLLMSSTNATSPSSHPSSRLQQHQRPQQSVINQPLISQNFDQSSALSNQAPNVRGGVGGGLSSANSNNNVPSSQQLKHMVQQIQLAVQAGHLNAQILNQPLAPMTLNLLYQLLQQIRILHSLQYSNNTNSIGSNNANKQQQAAAIPPSIQIQITKTKQTIANLQNQITAHQAIFLKDKSHSSFQPTSSSFNQTPSSTAPTSLPPGISSSAITQNQHYQSQYHQHQLHHHQQQTTNESFRNNSASIDSTSQQHCNSLSDGFRTNDQDLLGNSTSSSNTGGLTDLQNSWQTRSSQPTGVSHPNQQQPGPSSNDFARAPGPTLGSSSSKPTNVMAPRSSAWSYESDNELGWPSQSGISTATSSNHSKPTSAFDLVPEFEPGKPWRGSMLMKNVEDDPTMTPGSMARSLASQRKTIWSD